MPKATWKGQVLAESDHCEVVEGNQYFPPDSINKDHFEAKREICMQYHKRFLVVPNLQFKKKESRDSSK